jgi:hypothetical protein
MGCPGPRSARHRPHDQNRTRCGLPTSPSRSSTFASAHQCRLWASRSFTGLVKVRGVPRTVSIASHSAAIRPRGRWASSASKGEQLELVRQRPSPSKDPRASG